MAQLAWQNYSLIFRELLQLESSPVAVACVQEKPKDMDKGKVRMCRAILDASAGQSLKVYKGNNACFGATWHLGFHKTEDPQVRQMTKKFVVEGEKLFANYEALENLTKQMGDVPNNANACFLLSPMERAEIEPQLVIFVCNPEQACRLLTFVTFQDGIMPKIQMGGPTCRMAVMYPLLSGEVNISFQDYTARKLCNMDKNMLLVCIPYKKIPAIIESIDRCSAGRAKVEFPQEFREFLQKRTRVIT